MRKVFVFFLFFLFSLPSAYSGEISIHLTKGQIITEALEFYTLDYPFFDLKTGIGKIEDSDDTLSYYPNETSSVYFDYGPWQCYFFVEKDRDYQVILPDISKISEEWKRNPFFKKEKIHVDLYFDSGFPGETDINTVIRDFEKEFKPFIDKQILRYYQPELAKQKRDSFILVNYKPIDTSDQSFYLEYIRSKKAILEFSSSDHDLLKLIKQYLSSEKANFRNPAYRNLFELLLQDYFNFKSQFEGFNDLLLSLHNPDPSDLLRILENDPLMENDMILEYVVYNEIYKAYYSGFYNKSKLLSFMDSFSAENKVAGSKKLAEHIKKKFLNMETGYPVPAFKKISIQGDTLNTDSLYNKYIYLGFLDITGFASLQEIEYLKLIYSKHKKYLDIISFIITPDPENLKEFIEHHSIQWPVIPVERNDRVLVDYQVRAIPVFYLVDKNGKLLFNPAAAPSENFEYQLFELLKYRKEIVP